MGHALQVVTVQRTLSSHSNARWDTTAQLSLSSRFHALLEPLVTAQASGQLKSALFAGEEGTAPSPVLPTPMDSATEDTTASKEPSQLLQLMATRVTSVQQEDTVQQAPSTQSTVPQGPTTLSKASLKKKIA